MNNCAGVEQNVLLDAVTAYMSVIANQSLVEAQKVQRAVPARSPCRQPIKALRCRRCDADGRRAVRKRGLIAVSPTSNNAEVNYAISQATYTQVIGVAPGRLDASGADRQIATAPARRRGCNHSP